MVSFINDKLTQVMAWWETLKSSEKGQGLVEYALIIALISIVAALALAAMTGGFEDIADAITGALSDASADLGGS